MLHAQWLNGHLVLGQRAPLLPAQWCALDYLIVMSVVLLAIFICCTTVCMLLYVLCVSKKYIIKKTQNAQ